MTTIFDLSKKGLSGCDLPSLDVPKGEGLDEEHIRSYDELKIPEVSEVEIVRHYTRLSKLNYGVDDGFYPLGSCTMKYNPKLNEDICRLKGFSELHPYEEENQGALKLMYELSNDLCEITGMDSFTLSPAAGAHGELTGLMIMKKYFEGKRNKIIIPDSSHGTNPASATLCGFETIVLKSDEEGGIDLIELDNAMDETVVGIMLTNPNTLGLFERDILKITKTVHDKGGLVYCDGANMNAIMAKAKPADMGFDIIHLNLHKTFSTPHGGGGPGSGPVGVVEKLKDYLPNPSIKLEKDDYVLNDNPQSIGRIRAFYGNFGVLVKAYTYIKSIGNTGLREVSENAVLNANYMMNKLKPHFNLQYNRVCMHEFVINDKDMPNHITTNDIAKRLLDYGYHAPTVYFPLIVPGAIMIEPTETETKERMDNFIEAMIKIKKEAEDSPDLVKNAPNNTPVGKLDAVKAAREPILKYE